MPGIHHSPSKQQDDPNSSDTTTRQPRMTLEKVYDSITRGFDNMDKRFTKLEEVQANLERRIIDIENNRIELIETTTNLRQSVERNAYEFDNNIRRLHEQLNEEKERLRRAHNILLMGIPETEDGLQQAADTMNLILPNIRVTIVNQRVGLVPTTNPRPLRIFLSNAAEVRTALTQSKLLKTNPSFRNVTVRKDMTKLQREENQKRMLTRSQTSAAGSSTGISQKATGTEKRKADEDLQRTSKSAHRNNPGNNLMDI
jgi:hypothetical protein